MEDEHQTSYPILSQLVYKYLSISAMSVSSELLFSDVENNILAKRTRLTPDLVNHILFLKQNTIYFPMFSPLENDE
ncbi:20596_t:CDS:2 [Cetraspora pellucida]|uniref:20596_t:CDS:1 n=1 Tax=Cetraspora pellucida TaxID=1433469 RepID=A0A9N9DV90_9GLOM|nr:20596_t:CDS:2 [Cetraspora pellucida]